MNVGRTKLVLFSTAAALLAAGGLAVVAAARWPLAEADKVVGNGTVAIIGATSNDPPLSSFAPAWSLDLRRPLSDAATPATSPSDTVAGTLPVRLVGTILGPSRPRGIFISVLGQMEMKAVGEKAGGAEILSIDERGATLSIAGRPVILKIEKIETTIPDAGPAQPPSANSEAQPVETTVR